MLSQGYDMALLQDFDSAFYLFDSQSRNYEGNACLTLIAYLYTVGKLNSICISRIPNKHYFESANCLDHVYYR